jgi:hypothetical protein
MNSLVKNRTINRAKQRIVASYKLLIKHGTCKL